MKLDFFINDDEIRVLGDNVPDKKKRRRRFKWKHLIILIVAIVAIAAGVLMLNTQSEEPELQPLVEDSVMPVDTVVDSIEIHRVIAPVLKGYVLIKDTTVNNIPLKLFLPRNSEPELVMGKVDLEDEEIVLGAMAADIGPDRRKGWIVVGGFVYKGEVISRSKSKYGFCAINKGKINLGRSLETSYFEKCVTDSGDFFRQYDLIDSARVVSHRDRRRAMRRALCERGGEFFVVETLTTERLDDFAQALKGLQIENAITLMGSSMSVRWAVDKQGRRYETGGTDQEFPDVVNYIVWRNRKN